MNHNKFIVIILITMWASLSVGAQTDYFQQWPQFRGPFASGIVESTQLPESWDINTGENIRWKIKIPGLGHSCPVIWEDKLFLTTAISGSGNDSLKVGLYGDIDEVGDRSAHEFKLYCFNKYSGEILWEKLVHRGIPGTERHTKSSHANPTPATNGKYVVAFFGSEGLYCYNFDGELIWKKDFGKMNAGPYTGTCPHFWPWFNLHTWISRTLFADLCHQARSKGRYHTGQGQHIQCVYCLEYQTWRSLYAHQFDLRRLSL